MFKLLGLCATRLNLKKHVRYDLGFLNAEGQGIATLT